MPTRPQLVVALKKIASGLDRPLMARDVPMKLWRIVLHEFGSVAAARETAGLPAPPLNHRWTEDEVLDEIRRVAKTGIRIVHTDLKHEERHDLLGAIRSYFGGIARARRLAGVAEPPRASWSPEPWDEERVIAMILERYRAGETLASSKVPGRYIAAAIRYFGSWREAIEAAGLDYDQVRLRRPVYTKPELLALLRALPTSRPDMTREDLFSLPYQGALVRQFGSVDRALQRAGLGDFPPRVRGQLMSASDVLAALRARRRRGKTTLVADVQSEDHLLWFSVKVHFESWDSALAAAELAPDSVPRGSWTREKVLEALRTRHAAGRSLRTTTIMREDPALHAAAKNEFDGYVAAAREVDGAPWATIDWSHDRVIADLRAHARSGGQLTQNGVGSALANACGRYFGNFSSACRAAGLRR